MATSGQDLVDDMRLRGGNLSTAYSALVTQALNDTILEVATSSLTMPRIEEIEATANYTTGSSTGKIQEVLLTVFADDIWIPLYLTDLTNENRMVRTPLEELDRESSSEQAEVTRYAIWGDKLVFAPAISTETTFRLRYISTVDKLTIVGTTITGNSPFPQEYDHILKCGGLAKALVAINASLAAAFQQQYQMSVTLQEGRKDYHDMLAGLKTIRVRR